MLRQTSVARLTAEAPSRAEQGTEAGLLLDAGTISTRHRLSNVPAWPMRRLPASRYPVSPGSRRASFFGRPDEFDHVAVWVTDEKLAQASGRFRKIVKRQAACLEPGVRVIGILHGKGEVWIACVKPCSIDRSRGHLLFDGQMKREAGAQLIPYSGEAKVRSSNLAKAEDITIERLGSLEVRHGQAEVANSLEWQHACTSLGRRTKILTNHPSATSQLRIKDVGKSSYSEVEKVSRQSESPRCLQLQPIALCGDRRSH